MPHVAGMDLKVERVRSRVTAVRLAEEMGVTRQRVAAIEGDAVVTAETAGRYRAALMSLTSAAEIPAAEVA
jgi:plasmid maintenance system antidote protein VapI